MQSRFYNPYAHIVRQVFVVISEPKKRVVGNNMRSPRALSISDTEHPEGNNVSGTAKITKGVYAVLRCFVLKSLNHYRTPCLTLTNTSD